MSSKQHVASTILWTPSKGGIVTAVELRIHCIHFYISAFFYHFMFLIFTTLRIFSLIHYHFHSSKVSQDGTLITLYRVRLRTYILMYLLRSSECS